MAALASARPSSHSGRYKRGERAASGKIGRWNSWQLQVEELQGDLSKREMELKALKAEVAQMHQTHAANVQKLEQDLAWEQKRRLQLEGAKANERDAQQQLRAVKNLVRKFRRAGQLAPTAASQLLGLISLLPE